MSTRANIILTETYSYKARNGRQVTKTKRLYFYRHSDGYPEGALPVLNKFMDWLRSGKIRTDLSQGSGWLVILGAIEYNTIPEYLVFTESSSYGDMDTIEAPKDWKVGSIEPTTEIHGDINYLYTIDLSEKSLRIQEKSYTDEGEEVFRDITNGE